MKINSYKLIKGGLDEVIYEIHIKPVKSLSEYHLRRYQK